MKKILIIVTFLSTLFCFSQKEASNWYFGDNTGIRFNANGTVTELTNGRLSTTEGCATISDANGDLLFYTDGVTVWNKNHGIMPNGTGLFGDPSSTQSAIVVPKPADPNIYYIFTVDTSVSDRDPNFGFNYSIVNLSLDNGLGSVTLKNDNLLRSCSEKVTAVVKDCISQSIWVITYAPFNTAFNNTFFAYEVSTSGLNTTPVTSEFSTSSEDSRGYLKLSPDGTKLVSANASSGLYIYDFDKNKGIVSNEKKITINLNNQISYGVEFSQNNELLYVSTYMETSRENSETPPAQYGTLLQYNLTAPNISNSEIVIDRRATYRGGLQLGPNGKIYRAMNATYNQGSSYLSVINAPNNIGTACNYTNNSFRLSTNSRQGLPPFITSFFSEKIDIIRTSTTLTSTELFLCDGDTFTLKSDDIPGATYTWTRNDVPLSKTDADLEITEDGFYKVFIDPNTGDCDSTFEGVAYVTYNNNPVALDYTLTQCDEDGMAGGTTRFNLNEAKSALTGGVTGLDVKFYTDATLTDANEITNSNSYVLDADTPQPVFAKVFDIQTACYDVSVLTLEVSLSSPIPDFNATPICDEIDSEDGKNTFNRNDITTEIQKKHSFLNDISYYKTFDEALLEQDPLGITFINTNPYNETIYARAENTNSCFGIFKVILTVNKLPNITTEESIYYCLNQFPNTIKINAGLLEGTSEDYKYYWSTGETDQEIQINQTDTYTVTVTNANGCSKDRVVLVKPSNIATINNVKIKDASQNNTVSVMVSGEGTYEYSLLDEDMNTYQDFQSSSVFENIKSGFYHVIVKDIKNDCGTTEPLKISIIGFPKVFTPNGDGMNDTWQVHGVSGMFQSNTIIYIFDRYGKLLKELSPLSAGWNGTFNGNQLPTADYWFNVTLQDGRNFRGHFTLKR